MTTALIIIGFALWCGWGTIVNEKEDRGLGFIIGAAVGAAVAGGIVWFWHWLADGGWVWFFLLIIVVPVWFWLGCMALCLVLHIADRCRPYRD